MRGKNTKPPACSLQPPAAMHCRTALGCARERYSVGGAELEIYPDQPLEVMLRDYRRIEVWQKAHVLAVMAYRASVKMPRVHMALAGQLRRSAASIPTNIAEGCGHASGRELARFLSHSCASANEFEYQILLAKDVGAMHEALHADLENRIREVRRMLVAYRSRIREDHE